MKTVYVEVRNQGALGVFSWRSIPVAEPVRLELGPDSNYDEAHNYYYRTEAIKIAQLSGYETRGITLKLEEVPSYCEYGTLFEGKCPI